MCLVEVPCATIAFAVHKGSHALPMALVPPPAAHVMVATGADEHALAVPLTAKGLSLKPAQFSSARVEAGHRRAMLTSYRFPFA